MPDDLELTQADPLTEAEGTWRRVHNYGPPDVYVLVREDPDAGEGQDRQVIHGVAAVGDSITASDLGRIPLGAIARKANKPSTVTADQLLRELPQLSRSTSESTEEFAKRVAWYYKLFSGISSSPAKAIAEHGGIPVRRVHYWIAEARRLKVLPTGRQGRVG